MVKSRHLGFSAPSSRQRRIHRPNASANISGETALCAWWNQSICYDFEVGWGYYPYEISWVIRHPKTDEELAYGGANST